MGAGILIYTINWVGLLVQLVPVLLRKPRMLGFITGCIAPVVTLHTALLAHRALMLRRATYSGQHMRVEFALNWEMYPDEGYDPQATWTLPGHRIWIVNNLIGADIQYIFAETEGQTAPILPNDAETDPAYYLSSEAELYSETTFTVFAPAALQAEKDAQLRYWIRRCVPYHATYTINYY